MFVFFVTFEGPEGGGKSTLIRSLATWLEAEGREVVVTREPGAGELGVAIRKLLLESGDVPPLSELFLFLADRANHVATIIRPALDSGKVVLCDRHADSTIVYQGYGRGMDIEELRKLNLLATAGLQPTLTFLLDVPAEVGLARQTKGDRLDLESIEFHQKVRNGFITESKKSARWKVLDAQLSSEEVLAQAKRIVSEQPEIAR